MIKTIFILWFQGFDNSPDIVKKCVKSWKYYNPDWEIILLNNHNLNKYINLDDYLDISKKKIEKCHLSDLIRVMLLKKYGGLWVDATTFCNQSLNDWLPNYINEGFFAFDKPGPDRLISNWFLYSEKDHYIITEWSNSTLQYYKINDKAHTYFIHHYLFGDLYNSDSQFKEIWNKVPKLSANGYGPHYLQEKGLFNSLTPQIKKEIDAKTTPLYKLSHKCRFQEYNETKNIYYLYSTIDL